MEGDKIYRCPDCGNILVPYTNYQPDDPTEDIENLYICTGCLDSFHINDPVYPVIVEEIKK